MRLLMLTSSYPCREDDWRGGFVRDLGRALVRGGLEVTVVAPRPPEPFEEPHPSDGDPDVRWLPCWLPARARGFHGTGLESALARDPWALANLPSFLTAFALEAMVHATFADAIVAHWLFPMGFVGVMLAQGVRKPCGIVAHSGPPWPARLPGVSRIVRALVGRAASVACVSESVREEVVRVAGGEGRLAVLPLGIDLRPSGEPPALDHRPMRCLFVGRLVRLKGVDILLEAARRIRDPNDVHWSVIGDGPEAPRLWAGAPQSVRFLGEVDPKRVRAEMATHDVLVIPSRSGPLGRREGMPRVLLEAWACGRPVLGTALGGVGEAIRRHGGGILFAPDDPDGLIEAVRSFRSDADLRRRLREEALSAAVQYAWERVAPDWVAWVRGLVAGGDSLVSNDYTRSYWGSGK